jgi:hypothetical protein
MEDVDEFLTGRRDVLKTTGTALAAGLGAGCLGNEDETQDDTTTEETGTESTQTGDEDATEATTGTYPQQESQNLQSDIDQFIRENEGLYGLKAATEDIDIKNFSNVAENFPGYENKQDMLGETSRFEIALYVISEAETPAGSTEDIYFAAQHPTKSPNENNSIAMYANANEQNTDLTDQKVQVLGAPREYGEERLTDTERVIDLQQDFLSDTLSADDVAHAVNLEDSYVEDAIK